MIYADILTDIDHRRLDRLFTYSVPEEMENLIRIGVQVEVLFAGRIITGYVIRLTGQPEYQGRILPVRRVLSGRIHLPGDLIATAGWLAENSFVSRARAFDAVFPTLGSGRFPREKGSLTILPAGLEKLKTMRRSPSRKVLEELAGRGRTPWKELAEITGAGPGILARLVREELVTIHPPVPEPGPEEPVVLTPRQAEVLAPVQQALETESGGEFYLHGVTGSGKTEVYLEAIRVCLAAGRQALVLLPEIALTEEMIARYRKVFGDQVMAWHSQVSPARKRLIWDRMMSGESGVLLGARSAVFAGMRSPGLIIVDEEHESSFRQTSAPAYDGREAARFRANYNGAVLLMGSATPSTEAWHRIRSGESRLLTLPERYGGSSLPRVEIVDMREELRAGNRSIFSRRLQEEIEKTLAAGRQVLLFLNRRGYSGAFVCRSCGQTMECPRCEIPFTYHSVGDCLKCHYCGITVRAPKVCPACGSDKIRSFGTGTQKVEKEAARLFPAARTGRIDSDVGDADGRRSRLIGDLKEGRLDILIGTQMIARGIDFPDVGLAAVLAADLGLGVPDYRAREKTCQQLVQVAGRAGRKEGDGLCLIQTYQPESPAVWLAREDLYLTFLEEEMEDRRQLGYPPWRQAIRIMILGENLEKVQREEQRFARILREEIPDFLGPAPAAYGKIKGMYRHHIIVLGPQLPPLREAVTRALARYTREENSSGVYLNGEINPGSML